MRQNTYMNHVWSAREVKEEESIEASNAITPGYTHHFFVGIRVTQKAVPYLHSTERSNSLF